MSLAQWSRQIAPADIAIKALDIITIVIPPALPAAMTVGKLFALSRLKLSKIYCINSRVINVSGSVDCVCFDKVRHEPRLTNPPTHRPDYRVSDRHSD